MARVCQWAHAWAVHHGRLDAAHVLEDADALDLDPHSITVREGTACRARGGLCRGPAGHHLARWLQVCRSACCPVARGLNDTTRSTAASTGAGGGLWLDRRRHSPSTSFSMLNSVPHLDCPPDCIVSSLPPPVQYAGRTRRAQEEESLPCVLSVGGGGWWASSPPGCLPRRAAPPPVPAAISPASISPASLSPTASAPQASAASADLTWQFWIGGTEDQAAWEKVAAQATADHPGIKVTLQGTAWPDYWSKIGTQLTQSQGPCIVGMQSLRRRRMATPWCRWTI